MVHTIYARRGRARGVIDVYRSRGLGGLIIMTFLTT